MRAHMAEQDAPPGPQHRVVPRILAPTEGRFTGIADHLNRVHKYVLSTTLQDPGWEPTTILRDLSEVRALQNEPGRLGVTGSITVARQLVDADLIDEYRLFVYPVLVGDRPWVSAGGEHRGLELAEQHRFVGRHAPSLPPPPLSWPVPDRPFALRSARHRAALRDGRVRASSDPAVKPMAMHARMRHFGVVALPSGTVTFLFTDLRVRRGCGRNIRRRCRGVVGSPATPFCVEVESRCGMIVKTTGDGVHAVFAVASDAVDAAVSAQLAFCAGLGLSGPIAGADGRPYRGRGIS